MRRTVTRITDKTNNLNPGLLRTQDSSIKNLNPLIGSALLREISRAKSSTVISKGNSPQSTDAVERKRRLEK